MKGSGRYSLGPDVKGEREFIDMVNALDYKGNYILITPHDSLVTYDNNNREYTEHLMFLAKTIQEGLLRTTV